MSTPITYYAIIGRIPEDDEDSCYFFESDDPDFEPIIRLPSKRSFDEMNR